MKYRTRPREVFAFQTAQMTRVETKDGSRTAAPEDWIVIFPESGFRAVLTKTEFRELFELAEAVPPYKRPAPDPDPTPYPDDLAPYPRS